MSCQEWDATSFRPADRFAYWRDVVCETVLNVDAERGPHGSVFQARIAGRDIGDGRLASFASSPHSIIRKRKHFARALDGGYLLSWQMEGRSLVSQNDRTAVLDPGDLGIVDSERSFRVDFLAPVKRMLALVPRRQLEEKAPWFKSSGPLRIGADHPLTRLICDHFSLMLDRPSQGIRSEGLLLENVFNLIALATVSQSTDGRGVELPTDTLLAFCRKNLHRPDLSPSYVSLAMRISIRTLHARFQKMQTTFGAWILAERLGLCRRALENPLWANRSISEIAYNNGFRDISHFSKAYKTHFGVPPSEWRKLHLLRNGR